MLVVGRNRQKKKNHESTNYFSVNDIHLYTNYNIDKYFPLILKQT